MTRAGWTVLLLGVFLGVTIPFALMLYGDLIAVACDPLEGAH